MLPELLAVIGRLPVFAMVAARLGGAMTFMPVIGGLAIPARIRAMIVIGLAAAVTPLVDVSVAAPTSAAGVALALANELLLGVLLGLILRFVFLGLELGGLMIAQQSGLAFGQIADPTSGVEQSLLGAFYVQLAGVVFLIIGGHRVVLAVALDTFATVPLLGDGGLFADGVGTLVTALTTGTSIAIRIAAPVMLTLFLINVALGFIGRTVPQLNIVTIGFPIKGLLALMLMAVSLPMGIEAFTTALSEMVDWIEALTRNV